MITPINAVADPIAIYLMDGASVGPLLYPVPGIVDFTLTVANPAADAERDAPRRIPRRAWRLRRRRRANPGDLTLTLDYNPLEPAHRELLDAGERDARLTLRIVMQDAAGAVLRAQDVDCSVLRCTLSIRPARRRRRPDDAPRHICEADLWLRRQGDFRPLPLLDAPPPAVPPL